MVLQGIRTVSVSINSTYPQVDRLFEISTLISLSRYLVCNRLDCAFQTFSDRMCCCFGFQNIHTNEFIGYLYLEQASSKAEVYEYLKG